MRNKKIVLLISPLSNVKVGGISTWTNNILKFYEHSDIVNLVHFNTMLGIKHNLVESNFKRVVFGVLDSIYIIFNLIFSLFKYKPDVIHYTSSASLALLKDFIIVVVSNFFKSKFIIHWHFGRIPELIESNNFEWKVISFIIKLSDISIVIDKKSYDSLKTKGVNNIEFIANPISDELEKLARKIECNNKKINIGTFVFVGHIVRAKGVYELVQACCNLEKVRNLILVGPVLDITKEELVSLSQNRDRGNWLNFVGEVDKKEVYDYLISANAMCLPSYSEGFPNVVLESMALGCPVIASNVGAIEDMIKCVDNNNSAGICIESKNIWQLQSAIMKLCDENNEVHDFCRIGNIKVLKEYTLKIVSVRLEKLWLSN